VGWAATEMDVSYPIAVDSEYAIWQAFDNHYWPAVYLADGNGRIRFHHFGESAYDRTERAIQELLRESGRTTDGQLVGVSPRGLEVAADFGSLRSPESYLGHEKGERFASPGDARLDAPRVYTAPPRLALNQWALAGDWTVKRGAAVLNAANGTLVYRFHARDVNLVMGPARGVPPVRFAVKIDGEPPVPRTEPTSTNRGTGLPRASGPTNSCVSSRPLPIASSRYSLSSRAWKRFASPSGSELAIDLQYGGASTCPWLRTTPGLVAKRRACGHRRSSGPRE
jgi:Thioredoxin like C-terminal domain